MKKIDLFSILAYFRYCKNLDTDVKLIVNRKEKEGCFDLKPYRKHAEVYTDLAALIEQEAAAGRLLLPPETGLWFAAGLLLPDLLYRPRRGR